MITKHPHVLIDNKGQRIRHRDQVTNPLALPVHLRKEAPAVDPKKPFKQCRCGRTIVLNHGHEVCTECAKG